MSMRSRRSPIAIRISPLAPAFTEAARTAMLVLTIAIASYAIASLLPALVTAL